MMQKFLPTVSSKVFVGLALLYAFGSFFLPTNSESRVSLGLQNTEYITLLFIIRLPIVIVWCLIYFAFRALSTYTATIKDSPEGKHFALITKGMGIIAWGFLLPAIAATILNSFANTFTGFRMYSLISTNYIYVLITLAAFSYIGAGAHRLARDTNIFPSLRQIRVLVFALVVVGVVFCYLIASKLHGNNLSDAYNAYYLPNIAVWATIVIPYLYAWFLGIFAALELVLIARKTPGIIYRKALLYVAVGLVSIIAAMFLLQYLRAVVPRTGSLRLGSTLILTYFIYGLGGLGSYVMAIGARRLKRIEDI